MPTIECVPNFSEGRRREILEEIVGAASKEQGVRIADFSLDPDHNRSVLTLIGEPDPLVSAVLAASERALELIDMRTHRGVHPRIGSVDVVPFIPLLNASMQEAVTAAHRFGREFARRNNVPVYFYGEAARTPERRLLATIRRGGYEHVRLRLADQAWQPDEGPPRFDPARGATAVGARKPLVAFNINLDTNDLAIARDIARTIRHSSGGLPHVQAIGIPLASRAIVQVSMNLMDCEITPLITVYDKVREEAENRGVAVIESELIGLMPESALAGTTAEYLKICNFRDDCVIECHL
ncbi:MAG: glutamate formimidoyltransferase [Syntrophales bacterium]|jgi:glutamate formiminotransferase|nr:glutamate formimidoyltransferase [Syntrophales bacterium]MCK9527849.1 glutamate formimidoyltransferase [Syntrophales bacterium]MDX9922053.1 glutamate formimidoyltransferase [Syntrophales bacterium]